MNIQSVLDELRRASKTDGVELLICELEKNGHAAQYWDHDGPEVWLRWIESSVKGAGAIALRKLVEAADFHNVMLRAALDDDGSGRLKSYYAKFGFQVDPAGGDIIERPPMPPERVQKFRAWFRDSKVVNSDGSPRVVYHGTNASFERFRTGDEGIFFTECPLMASEYAVDQGVGGANVVPTYLAIKNPLRMTWREWLRGVTDSGFQHCLEGNVGLEKLGYDGVILTEPDKYDPYMSAVTYVAFRPEQIKSAISNSGAYDPSCPDMTDGAAAAARELCATLSSLLFEADFIDCSTDEKESSACDRNRC